MRSKHNKRSRTWMLALLMGVSFIANSQTAFFNSEDYWNRFLLQKDANTLNIAAGDTVAIIASNRAYQDTSLRFLLDVYEGSLHYFIIHSKKGKWEVTPVKSLKDAIDAMPVKNKDWVIYTEGMGKLFTTGADRAMRMNAAYDVNVIYLDYPSIKAKWRRTRNYFYSKHKASIAHKDFAPVFDTIRMMKTNNKMGDKTLNLFFHSMGNIVLQKMVLKDKIKLMNNEKWVDNLILNAACVPQRKHAQWLDKIQFAKHGYVLYNPRDFTLGGAYFMSKKNQLGMKVKKPISSKITYINFERVAGQKHSNFLNLLGYPPQPEEAIALYENLLHGKSLNLQDSTHFTPSSHRGIGYDLLKQ